MTFEDDPAPPSGITLLRDEPLSNHTYFRVGGPARFFASPADIDEVERLTEWAYQLGLPILIIGGGSNLLVSDGGVSALVVSLRHACGQIRFEGTRVTAGAAVMMPALARASAAHGLAGLEFAIGIPGSVGGALQTNAGTGDGNCIGTLVRSVEILSERDVGKLGRKTLASDQLHFDYRDSSLRGSGDTVLAATLELRGHSRSVIEAGMRRLLEARSASQPTAQPNAGSIFRNPENDYAGRLVDSAGCKGMSSGSASVSSLHANFIVHDGFATAAEIIDLMLKVQRRVFERFDVWLEPEIEWWGDGLTPEIFADTKPNR